MHSTAKVYAHPRSPYYQAWFTVWDAAGQRWKPVTKSTRCTDEAKALTIARQFEKLALKAGGAHGDARVSREFVLEILNSILEISGQPKVEETRRWNEYAQNWLTLQRTRELAATSMEAYEGHVRSFTTWLGKDKDVPINTISGDLMQTWYGDRIDEGRKPKTVNNAVKTIQGIFDRARAEGFCNRNPAELILRQYGEADVREPFNLDDIAKILAHLRTPEMHDWLGISLLGLCTGQRLQDCAQADLADFQVQGSHLVWHLDQGKTGAKVDIPIVEPLDAHLRTLKKQKKHGLLAPTLADTPSGGTTGLSLQFSLILDAAGVERERRKKAEDSKGQSWTNKTFHSFRHTTNSLLANAGVSDDIRRKILGHSTTKMNLRYTHMEIKTLAEALKKAIPLLG